MDVVSRRENKVNWTSFQYEGKPVSGFRDWEAGRVTASAPASRDVADLGEEELNFELLCLQTVWFHKHRSA